MDPGDEGCGYAELGGRGGPEKQGGAVWNEGEDDMYSDGKRGGRVNSGTGDVGEMQGGSWQHAGTIGYPESPAGPCH